MGVERLSFFGSVAPDEAGENILWDTVTVNLPALLPRLRDVFED